MTSDQTNQHQGDARPPSGEAIELLRQSLDRIRFGSIQLTVHDGRLVQLDITEKRRFPSE